MEQYCMPIHVMLIISSPSILMVICVPCNFAPAGSCSLVVPAVPPPGDNEKKIRILACRPLWAERMTFCRPYMQPGFRPNSSYDTW